MENAAAVALAFAKLRKQKCLQRHIDKVLVHNQQSPNHVAQTVSAVVVAAVVAVVTAVTLAVVGVAVVVAVAAAVTLAVAVKRSQTNCCCQLLLLLLLPFDCWCCCF